MLSASVARALAARGIHYGWFMVALTMGYLLCSSATLSIPGVLLTPMSRDLGWSIGDLSGPLGLRVALFGLVAPFAGGLMLLYGPRAVITGSAIFASVAFGFLSISVGRGTSPRGFPALSLASGRQCV